MFDFEGRCSIPKAEFASEDFAEQRTYDASDVHHTSGSKGRASEIAWTRRAHSVELATVRMYVTNLKLEGRQTCSLVKRREDDAINWLTPKSIATLRQR